ncbi:hypothetical protein EYZ11_010950 [Aspergillus tanneri]|uniref:Only prolin and serin are matching in the corresponding protein n=1 Tax=Aspergillus tanneri TaxID=1220188 RepID=A0A4S3J440_9EURO|nr:uncharacterized protein ATNIH1004_009049 [Aspergillus tanneri]KAA8644841.1 hypothetical protein ATNIH1004_009049 [Aspergillus tanneri]THC89600.1 hypothetical protein EYZ11_010950 [Aspergillus tanneri]
MLKLSQLLDAKRRDSCDAMAELSPSSRQPPPSPLTATSSTPVSPAVSLFSAKGHTRFSSSVSSLVSSPGHGNSMESASRNPLTGVKEEEPCGAQARDLEEEYFQHFDQGVSELEDYFSPVNYSDQYDLTDAGMDVPPSPKKRRSDSISAKGLSRIGSRISTISTRWRSRHASDAPDGVDAVSTELRSRTNSASSVLASPTGVAISRVDSMTVPPSPARTIFEERISESGAKPIDIVKANRQSQEESAPQATTPLLPPFMGTEPVYPAAPRVNSPLQSPSVADMSEDLSDAIAPSDPPRLATAPSPPLSSKPSVASFNRPRASTTRTVSGEGSPFVLSDPNDEWANKLGHANFTIQPEPYVPEVYDLESFQQLRAQWDVAQCNFAKHLVRTGEHYGITSNIYKLTEEKWESINCEWKRHHETMLSQLEATQGPELRLVQSDCDPCEQLKIPRLHDDKFPELGDGEIVGPMKIAPATTGSGRGRSRSLKRSFLRFFQDLVSRP